MANMTAQKILNKVKQAAAQAQVKDPTPPKLTAPKQLSLKLPQISPILTARVI